MRDDDGVHIVGSPFRILITPGNLALPFSTNYPTAIPITSERYLLLIDFIISQRESTHLQSNRSGSDWRFHRRVDAVQNHLL